MQTYNVLISKRIYHYHRIWGIDSRARLSNRKTLKTAAMELLVEQRRRRRRTKTRHWIIRRRRWLQQWGSHLCRSQRGASDIRTFLVGAVEKKRARLQAGQEERSSTSLLLSVAGRSPFVLFREIREPHDSRVVRDLSEQDE